MKKSLVAVVVLFLAFTSMGYAQDEIDFIETQTGYNTYDFDFVGGGTRAKGMGNAFLGVSNDITGGSWNPAGIFELNETTIGVSWFNLSPKGKSYVTTSSDFTESKSVSSFNDISSINFVSPIRVSGHPFVFSFNLTRNFNNFTRVDLKESTTSIFTLRTLLKDYVDTLQVNTARSVQIEGGVNSMNVGFGTRLYNNISFGATVNIYSGRSLLRLEELSIVDDFRLDIYQTGILEADVSIEDTNKFSGANFTLGFMYNSDKLDVGLVIKTPFWLNENRNQIITANTYSRKDENSVKSLVSGRKTYSSDILYKYELPLMVGIGAGYQFKENWLLAGDIEYRGFSGKGIDYRISQTINPGGSNFEDYINIDPKWNNSISLRFGSEYIKTFGFGDMPFRTGFGFVQVPQPSVSIYGASSTVVNYNLTAGTGVHFEQIKLDIAYVYTSASSDLMGINGVIDTKNHVITVSFTGVF